jgi:hypothetical protein
VGSKAIEESESMEKIYRESGKHMSTLALSDRSVEQARLLNPAFLTALVSPIKEGILSRKNGFTLIVK